MRERITWALYLFANYPGSASNIDTDVRLESWREVIRYLPRAAEIGLLAPFPNMWLASGAQVGLVRLMDSRRILLTASGGPFRQMPLTDAHEGCPMLCHHRHALLPHGS